LSAIISDLRFALRRFRQSPGFAAVAILTLALGIGANTAIFTLIHAVMLKNLPVADPRELYRVGDRHRCCVIGGFQGHWAIFAYPLYLQFRNHTPEFSELAAFEAGNHFISFRPTGSANPAEPSIEEFVSGNYFTMLSLVPAAGRFISPADDSPAAPPVAVISYRLWQRLGFDPTVVGGVFNIDQVPFTVIGVTPPAFFGETLRTDPADFWLPLSTELKLDASESLLNRADAHWLYAIGRLKPGANPSAIQSELTVQLRHWLEAQPDENSGSGIGVQDSRSRSEIPKQQIILAPARTGVATLEEETLQGLRLLMTIAGLVLLIACANLANLLLARGASMRFETALRVALGAPRFTLIRGILAESVLLAVFGGLAGLFVAYAGTRAILLVFFRGAHYVPIDAAPSLSVLAFTFVLSLLTGIIFGVAPAWITSLSHPIEALRGAGRSTRDQSSLPRRALVVLQVALSAVLLIGAGLLTQTLSNLENQRFGFEPGGRIVVRIDPSLAGYTPDGLGALYTQLRERLPQIPGVLSAAYSLYSPMRGDNWSFGIHVAGRSPEDNSGSSFDRVSPGYFETVGTRVLRGRPITEQDTPTSRYVAVVNETFVRKFFPKTEPVGQHFGIGTKGDPGELEIVGVVEDTKYQDAREPAYPTFFAPFLQFSKDPENAMIRSHYAGDIEIHVAGRPDTYSAQVRRALADINPNLTVVELITMNEQLAQNFNQDRLIARLAALFGAVALILACVGLYGVTSYAVARRTSEIGIRMALGAEPRNVVGLILRSVLLQLAIGLAIGVPAALAAGRLLASQLFGVQPYNPIIVAAAAGVLIASAVAAGFIPARRAASIDPLAALRTE